MEKRKPLLKECYLLEEIERFCNKRRGIEEVNYHNDTTFHYSLGYRKACNHILGLIERGRINGRK